MVDNELQKQMAAEKIKRAMNELLENAIEDSAEWERGLTYNEIVAIVIEQALDIPMEVEEV